MTIDQTSNRWAQPGPFPTLGHAPGELEAHDIARLLSRPDRHADGVSRRRFLQLAAMGAGAVGAYTMLPGRDREAWSLSPIGAADGVLVLVTLSGGNDGLNTVVPYGLGAYYDKRKALAIAPETVLPIDNEVGFHPSLTWLHEQYQNGYVAVVEGVGYPHPDLSHFTSTALWMQGLATAAAPTTGWLGRYLDGIPTATFAGLSLGGSIPLVMTGAHAHATGVPESSGAFGVSTDANDRLLYQALGAFSAAPNALGPWADALNGATRDMLEVNRTAAPIFDASLPRNSLPRSMALAARLINLDVGARVIQVSLGGFDTHADQLGRHAQLLAQLDTSLRGFFHELDPRFADRVTVMTFSEFGRPITANDSGGTDHGTAGLSLVVGAQVRGGRRGQLPSLTSLDRYGQLTATVDYRSVFASVLDPWLRADSATIIGGRFSDLGLFTAGPGAPVPGPGLGSVGQPSGTASHDFTPMTPLRVLDTRDGTGGFSAPIGAQKAITLKVAGTGDLPTTGIAAVLMNVTVTAPTAPGYLTVWPASAERPLASSLNFVPGQTVPNLVVASLDADGNAGIFNSAGATHVIADVVGYFGAEAGAGLVALTPTRVLDTRSGAGGIGGAFGAGETRRLAIAGVSTVPVDGVTAVVMNVTVTEPTSPGYVTVYPAGQPRPVASNLNFMPGLTVPNLVVCKLGDGAVELFNSGGRSHLVADVVGYFSDADDGAGMVVVNPTRLADSRQGLGLGGALGGGEVAMLTVTGGGVPAGAKAVALNVTVTGPTAGGFLTVWPAGAPRPTASSLNFVANQTVPNLVVCAVGDGGRVAVFSSAGRSHVVADLVAWFA